MKRRRRNSDTCGSSKRPKSGEEANCPPTWRLLHQYYPQVTTLRAYLASRIPKRSKKRRRSVLQYGSNQAAGQKRIADPSVVALLDETVVGSFQYADANLIEPLDDDITVFTQQLSGSSMDACPTQGALRQTEIVDFTIWLLFRRHYGLQRLSHLLAGGYQKSSAGYVNEDEFVAVPGVPGVLSNFDNQNVQTLKQHPWQALPSLLGNGAESIISEMLLHCGVFQPVRASGNFTQLSGVPMSDLKVQRNVNFAPAQFPDRSKFGATSRSNDQTSHSKRGLSDIRFVRHRMLYAKATLNAKGKVHYNLGRAHVLNRFSDTDSVEETTHILRYVFPRQFGHHNVFTYDVDRRDTAQPFKDYMIREPEIAQSKHRRKVRWPRDCGAQGNSEPPLPKRLRTQALYVVARLRKRHKQCSYNALLEHYCPLSPAKTHATSSLAERTASAAEVSAFCRAVVQRVFPKDCWGTGEVAEHNQKVVLRGVDTFIRLRRYESMSLHDAMHGMKIHGVEWLAPAKSDNASKLSNTDFTKRRELMAEVVYYLFDSFLIPLIRGHFHVTESGAHRNLLLYLRHDVWKAISDPALASLKTAMLEECDPATVKRILAKQTLGVSKVRLLPKEHGMRPIINLRRRVQRLQHGELFLGRSINSILTPTFSILNYEKTARPEVLASALFSVEDMYPRLQAFRQALVRQGLSGEPLFFAKVDVKSCFDTIPQKRLMQVARSIVHSDAYHITKYARAKLVAGHNEEKPGFGAKPSWRFLTKATPDDKQFDFEKEIEADTADGRRLTVYVDGVIQKSEHRQAVLKLLEEHVESNLIKLGNRFYRQKEGIPQGSIVSSLLCSYFYGELEQKKLGFINDGQSILLRLIDDFLVISTHHGVAERFMRLMHGGIPEFGVEVKVDKSRANFDMSIDGTPIPRLPAATDFPYCGNAINTVTLDLSKDKERRRKMNLADSVTVEYSRLPGQTFYRKMLNALKLQMNAMLLSTAYNSLRTVLGNLLHCFTEVAQKSFHYMRSFPAPKQPSDKLVIRIVDDLIKLACVLMKRRKRKTKDIIPYECAVTDAQAKW